MNGEPRFSEGFFKVVGWRGLSEVSRCIISEANFGRVASCYIIVNYHSYDDVKMFFEESIPLLPDNFVIWVVDNSNSGEEERKLAALLGGERGVNVLITRSNLGYLGGARAALNEHCKMYGLPEYCIISNADLRLLGAGWSFLSDGVLEIDWDGASDMMMIAPEIIDSESGRALNPFMKDRPSRFKMIVLASVFSIPWIRGVYYWARRKGRVRGRVDEGEKLIYSGHGCLFILTRRFFAEGGTLDWPVLLYGEELYLAEQIKKLSGTVRFVPWLNARHVGCGSTGGSKRSWQMAVHGKALRILLKRYWR